VLEEFVVICLSNIGQLRKDAKVEKVRAIGAGESEGGGASQAGELFVYC